MEQNTEVSNSKTDVRAEAGDAVNDLGQRNPLGLAIGSVALGFLAGLMLPLTDFERTYFGPLGEQISASARSAAAGAIEQGKAAVSQAIGDAIIGDALRPEPAHAG